MAMTVLMFEHTKQGEAALKELVEAGVSHSEVSVIGDLGPAVSQPGAERHVTFDRLGVPLGDREMFMDTIRNGGVILGVQWENVDFLQEAAERHGAVSVVQVLEGAGNSSHNQASGGLR